MNNEKIDKVINYNLSPRTVNILSMCLLVCITGLLFIYNTEAITVSSDTMIPFHLWFVSSFGVKAYFTIMLIFLMLCCLFGDFFVGYLIMEITTVIFGISNRIVLNLREQFITVTDFNVLGEAAKVEINYKEYIFIPLVVVLVVLGCVNAFFFYVLNKKIKREGKIFKNKVKSYISRGVVFVLMFGCFIIMHGKPSAISFHDISADKKMGSVVWFCQSLFSNTAEVVSVEETQDIYANFQEAMEETAETEKCPNIIVIMSESFWNINNLDGIVEASDNPMDEYYELTKEAVTGEIAVNVYGGGTNMSEFEFLTGLNKRYLDTSDCYGYLYVHEQESIVSYLEELGYYTMAFHPYDGTYWERESGYANMGFDNFISDIDFVNRKICHGYISDKSLTQEIIDCFEERKVIDPNQPVFAFAVSVQNHVGDLEFFDEANGKTDCTGITVTINRAAEQEDIDNVEEYYNGLRETIEALEELMAYFEARDEDTIIVFFGDHAPKFLKPICGDEVNEVEMNYYRTPYMIWTNYENDYKTYGDFNLSYLSTVLIDYLDLPKPNQYYMNKYLLEHYPIDTLYEQLYYESLDEQRLLDMMSIVATVRKRFPKEEMALPFWQITQ